MMKNFNDLGITSPMLEVLAKIGFLSPTEVQEQTLPLVLAGSDVLGSAPTGTGKTGAFAIPILQQMLEDKQKSVLVLAPTRELATQIMSAFEKLLGNNRSMPSALLIGGAPMFPQIKQLRNNPRIVIGTPGRIIDHLERGTLTLDHITYLVLDETDRMLDLGFDVQIQNIVERITQPRQTLLFSATLPSSILKIANSYLNNPSRVSVGMSSAPSLNVTQTAVVTEEREKGKLLLQQIDERDGSIIIFVKTKRGAEELAERLSNNDHPSEAIHGDLRQTKRERILRSFRNQRFRIMVATDVAARGIDIPHIQHVINYDLPQCPEDYIHRIGRTGRGTAKGFAVSFISPSDNAKWRAIRRILDPESAKNLPEIKGFSGGNGNSDRGQPRRRPSGSGFGSGQGGREGGRSGGERRSFGGGEGKSFAGGERRSFGNGERKPFAGGERRSFDNGEKKPFAGGERRSFNNAGGERSYRDNATGERRPFAGGGERRSFDNGERKPFAGGERRSFDNGERKPFAGGERRSFDNGERKPFAGGEGKNSTWSKDFKSSKPMDRNKAKTSR